MKDQIEGFQIPEDVILRNVEPIDTQRMVIDQNKQRFSAVFKSCLEEISKVSSEFTISLAVHHLIDLEEAIIRSEWNNKSKKSDFYDDHERDIKEYVEARAECKKVLGDNFEQHYEQQRKTHNECAATNLKNSGRKLFCYVLPKFNADGTHEPWGEEDVPDPTYDPWGES
jgi:hypothetical protein